MELDLAHDCSLPALVAARVGLEPDTLVLRELDGMTQLTWRELQREGIRAAAGLASMGVQRGDLVLMMLGNHATGWIAQLAAANLAAVEVPVNSAYVGAWLDHVIATTAARIAIVDEALLKNWLAVLNGHPRLRTVLVVAKGPVPERTVGATRVLGLAEAIHAVVQPDGDLPEPIRSEPGDLATIMWTSGTTGKSKGVLMPWGQWWHRTVTSDLLPDGILRDDDVHFQPWPTFHVGGRQTLYRAAVAGGRVVLKNGFSATTWFDDVCRSEATWTYLIGAGTQLIMNTPRRPDDRDSALRFVLSGPASSLAPEMCERFGIEYYTSYGMSEINNPFRSAGYRITHDNWTSCGELHPSRTIRIARADGRDVGPGEVGELLVKDERADNRMALGYLGPPEVTDASWYGGWFHTGDLFRFDESGKYYFVDRAKDAIRRGGENISSLEVEAAINQHPDVVESAVVAVPAELAEEEVAAVLVLRGAFDPEAIYAHMEERIPKFARPRYLIPVEELPKTPSLKVRKAELRSDDILAGAWDARRDRART